jgi:hypothetical protein
MGASRQINVNLRLAGQQGAGDQFFLAGRRS